MSPVVSVVVATTTLIFVHSKLVINTNYAWHSSRLNKLFKIWQCSNRAVANGHCGCRAQSNSGVRRRDLAEELVWVRVTPDARVLVATKLLKQHAFSPPAASDLKKYVKH